jgi:hypothetical protein
VSDVKLAAYSAIATALSTEMNTLAATTGKAINATGIDNSTALDLFADFELVCTYGVAPAAGAIVELYLLPSVDGTNYPDASTAIVPQASLYVGGFALRAVTTAQRMVLRAIPLPSGLFKVLVQNTAGQAMAATGNTLKMRGWHYANV